MNITRREFNYGLVVSVGSLALRRFPAQTTLRVNGKRIMDHILALPATMRRTWLVSVQSA